LVCASAVVRAGLLRDAGRDNRSQGLHTLIHRGYLHMVVVVDHGATGTTVDGSPILDRPVFGRDLSTQLHRGALAFVLGGSMGVGLPCYSVQAGLRYFDLALQQGG